jgi:hypothetical protein
MYGILAAAIILATALSAIFIIVTNKAYSRKWDEDEDETRGGGQN